MSRNIGEAPPEASLTWDPEINTPNSGILTITLHDGVGLSLPGKHRGALETSHSTSRLPVHSPLNTPGPLLLSSSQRSAGSSEDSSVRQSSGGFKRNPTNKIQISDDCMPYALIDYDNVQVFAKSVGGTPENPLWASNTQYRFDVSRTTGLSIYLYATRGPGRDEDVSLGIVRIKPWFGERHRLMKDLGMSQKDQEKVHTEFESRVVPLGFNGVDLVDVQHGTGKLKIGVEYTESRGGKLKLQDFDLLKVVGKGTSGKVLQVRKKDTNRIYALKAIRKHEVAHLLAKQPTLAQMYHPFIVPLKLSFQTPEKIYFISTFMNGKELFHQLQQGYVFDVNRARLYAAELLCALEYLHSSNIIYRDLRPENILLDGHGHIALCDFGLYRPDMKVEDRINAERALEYLAPELLLGKKYDAAVDWWTLGVLLYEMLSGRPPFYGEDTSETYGKVLSEPPSFSGTMPADAVDILVKLLHRDAEQRLGANGSAEIKGHPFFDDIDWPKLLQRQYEPEFKPNVMGDMATPYDDGCSFGPLPLPDKYEEVVFSQTMIDQFRHFTYKPPNTGLDNVGGSAEDHSYVGSL